MSSLLRGVLHDIIAQVDDPVVSIVTNIPACELRIVVQFVMFGKIPPGRVEDSYIPSKGMISIPIEKHFAYVKFEQTIILVFLMCFIFILGTFDLLRLFGIDITGFTFGFSIVDQTIYDAEDHFIRPNHGCDEINKLNYSIL